MKIKLHFIFPKFGKKTTKICIPFLRLFFFLFDKNYEDFHFFYNDFFNYMFLITLNQ